MGEAPLDIEWMWVPAPLPLHLMTGRTDNDGRTSDTLTIQLFKYIQIYHHSRNWMHCPRAIARDVDRLVDNINPPNATNTVR